MKRINPTEVLTNWLWKNRDKVKFTIGSDNKIFITDPDMLAILMPFQDWLIEQSNKKGE